MIRFLQGEKGLNWTKLWSAWGGILNFTKDIVSEITIDYIEWEIDLTRYECWNQ